MRVIWGYPERDGGAVVVGLRQAYYEVGISIVFELFLFSYGNISIGKKYIYILPIFEGSDYCSPCIPLWLSLDSLGTVGNLLLKYFRGGIWQRTCRRRSWQSSMRMILEEENVKIMLEKYEKHVLQRFTWKNKKQWALRMIFERNVSTSEDDKSFLEIFLDSENMFFLSAILLPVKGFKNFWNKFGWKHHLLIRLASFCT